MNNEMLSQEKELIARLQAHDARACEQLIDDYANMVFNVCYRILQDEQEAEDAMQETFLAVYRNIDAFRGDAKLSSWLYRVASNKALSLLRSRSRKQGKNTPIEDETGEALPIIDDQAVTAEKRIERQEEAAALQAGLAAMSPKLRAALTLYEIEGLSMKETAAALDISESAAKLRVHRGRQFLRNHLSQSLMDTGDF